jgi:hypothetical protein
MAKLIILSIVLASFAIPILLSISPQPKRALRRVQKLILIYIVIWALMCLYWYPSLVSLE